MTDRSHAPCARASEPLFAHAPDTARYERFARPGVARLLAATRLDATYERGEGDYLWVRRNGQSVRILDLVGGYGANLFGHHHPDLAAEVRRLLDAQAPLLAQGSIRAGAAQLAEALCARLGDFIVLFTNTGTETIEAAIKHLHLERQRPVLWAVRGAFHGKTSGAVQLTWSQHEQFAGLGPRVRFIDPDDEADWERARQEAIRTDDVAGFFIEPIQGEGGVRPLAPAFVDWIRSTTKLLSIPLVADEIQTGLGRTGTFLACEAMQLDPDYVCLSKALGGGFAKIGALLIRRSRFQESFAVSHTSTFAEDEWSSCLALKALEVLGRDRLVERCASVGDALLADLRELQTRYPDEIRDVRGRGLMVGVELADQAASSTLSIAALSDAEALGWLASAYLLNHHDIRIAPTISQPFTLRVEPSAYVDPRELRRFVDALELFCRGLHEGDSAHLLGFLVGRPLEPVSSTAARPILKRETPRTPRQVAFLGYFNAPEQLRRSDPSLARFTREELDSLIDRTSHVLGPVITDQVHVRSKTGAEVHLRMVGLDVTAERVAELRAAHDLSWITEQIESAVTLARDQGCQVIGLGGYTSSVTASCLRVQTKGIALTSGNSLAVGMSIRALEEGARRKGIDLAASWLGVVGVPGNIASIFATVMAPKVAGMVLVAHTLASKPLASLLNQLKRVAPALPIEASDTPTALERCQLIATATVGAGDLVQPEHLNPGPVAICDISVPSDVSARVARERPDVLVIPGGVVRIEGNATLSLVGLNLVPGHVLACLAETLIMGLDGQTTHGSYGAISASGVQDILARADRHGFVLADIGADLVPPL